MRILCIDHVQLAMPPGEERKAREYYQNLLGIPEIPKPVELAAKGGAWFENEAVKIHLGVEKEFLPARKAHPALVVSNLNFLKSTLTKAGYIVTDDSAIPGVVRFFSHDPFGNRIEFIQSAANGTNN